jgi:hypothetical protein
VDDKEELAKAKWLLGAGAFFLLSCFLVYDEFAYLVWGHETEATPTKAYEVTRGGRFGAGGSKRTQIDFAFTESSGLHRKGTVAVESGWSVPASGKVSVEYTPGELGRARLKGSVSWVAIVFFVGCLGAVAVAAVGLWREANEAYRPRKPKRKKRA